MPIGARFSAPVQTGPEAHPTSYTTGTESFPGVNRPGRGVDHPPPSSAEVKERVEVYLYSPFGPLWSILGWNLPLRFVITTIRTATPGNEQSTGMLKWNDSGLPPRCKSDHHSSALPLKKVSIGCSEASLTTNLCCVTFLKSEDLVIYEH